MDAEIKALQDELEKQGSVLSPEAADRKRQDIVKKTRRAQAFLEDGSRSCSAAGAGAGRRQGLNASSRKSQAAHRGHAKDKGIDILSTARWRSP
jgi:hypothetical protein